MQKLLDDWRNYLGSDKLVITERVSKTKGETKTLAIPKIALSEKWGMPGSDDRKLIDQFMSKIPGSTLAEKIGGIEAFISECTDEACIEKKNIPEILSNLVFLDSLASVVFDYNHATAGFLFESFLSALLKGTQVLGTGQIEDVLDAEDKPISLKLLRYGAHVEGSLDYLYNSVEKYGSVKYVICYKYYEDDEMVLDFHSFTIGSENADFLINWTGGSRPFPRERATKLARKRASSYEFITKNGKDWKWPIKAADFVHDYLNMGENLGTLKLGSRESITEVATRYVSRLSDSLVNIFNLLNSLTKNVNTYFLEDNKAAGLAAKENADNLAINIRETIL